MAASKKIKKETAKNNIELRYIDIREGMIGVLKIARILRKIITKEGKISCNTKFGCQNQKYHFKLYHPSTWSVN
jgi:hypothetical protein